MWCRWENLDVGRSIFLWFSSFKWTICETIWPLIRSETCNRISHRLFPQRAKDVSGGMKIRDVLDDFWGWTAHWHFSKWGWETKKNSLRIVVSVSLFKETSFRNSGLSCEHIKSTVSDSCGWALKPQSSRETFAWPGGWEREMQSAGISSTDLLYIITSIWVMLQF